MNTCYRKRAVTSEKQNAAHYNLSEERLNTRWIRASGKELRCLFFSKSWHVQRLHRVTTMNSQRSRHLKVRRYYYEEHNLANMIFEPYIPLGMDMGQSYELGWKMVFHIKVCSVVCANCPMDLALGAKIKLVHHALKITPEGVTRTSSRVVCVISLRASSLHLLTNIQGWLTALSMLGAWQPYILCLPHSAQPSLIPSVCGKAPCA